MNPIMAVGIALAFSGFALFAGTMFRGGGTARSEQFRVVGEVLRGAQGAGPRRAMLTGLFLCAVGVLTTFAGVTSRDAGRGARCEAYCRQRGFTQSALGPAEEVPPGGGRAVRYFACTCTRPDGARTQTRANDL